MSVSFDLTFLIQVINTVVLLALLIGVFFGLSLIYRKFFNTFIKKSEK